MGLDVQMSITSPRPRPRLAVLAAEVVVVALAAQQASAGERHAPPAARSHSVPAPTLHVTLYTSWPRRAGRSWMPHIAARPCNAPRAPPPAMQLPAPALARRARPPTPLPDPAAGFVYRSGNQLYLDGNPFYFVGMNSYWMPSTAAFGETGSVDAAMAHAQVGTRAPQLHRNGALRPPCLE